MQDRPNVANELQNIMLAVRKGKHLPVRGRLNAGDDLSLYRTSKQYPEEDITNDLTADDVSAAFEKIGKRIAMLRQRDFDYYYTKPDGGVVFIKDNLGKSYQDLNPVHPDEAEIQFLRYLRGVLLMAQNSKDIVIGEGGQYERLKSAVAEVYAHYVERKKSATNLPKLTLEMAGELIAQIKEINAHEEDKYAGMQLTMARDLASMLETHPDTCTVASMKGSDVITVSRSTLQKVSGEFYETFMRDIDDQAWVQSARRMQGLNPHSADWMTNCLKSNFHQFKAKGNPTVPSARWLPLPATYFHEEKATIKDGKSEYDSYIRTGVMIPFDVRHVPSLSSDDKYIYQREIATQIAKEIMRAQVPRNIERFMQLYQIAPGEKFPFYVNYQTLLSPLMGELGFKHTDNNARFVKLVGDVFKSLSRDELFLRELAGQTGAEIVLTHTNSAVNRNAWLTSSAVADKMRQFKQNLGSASAENTEDNNIRKERLQNVRSFIENKIHSLSGNDDVLLEMSLRAAAADSLERLLNNEKPYAKLEVYQKNIMMAALDHLVIGSQGLSIDGCKSCRDRTEVFSAAVKVMKENPAAMQSWEQLEAGIKNSLMQGHGFRSVGFHVAVVKASLVHKRFSKSLTDDVQSAIKAYTPFSKALKEVDPEEQQEEKLNKVSGRSTPEAGSRGSFSGFFSRPRRSDSEPLPRTRRKSREQAPDDNEPQQGRKSSAPGKIGGGSGGGSN